jgi:serine/threonine-protein kinase RsbW
MSALLRSTMFSARFSELEAMRLFLEAFCADAAIARTTCLRLNLVLEELFTNTVSHGHGGDCDAPVWVSLAGVERQVTVTYEDTARPFNPYARLFEPGPKPGGLGVLLTRELSASRDYAYLFGRNCIRLAVNLA